MLSTLGIYLNDFSSVNDVMNSYGISEKELDGVRIMFADYTYEDYNGSSFVLFEKDGKLYEVNGSHCSCFGLEDQWEPEEVLIEELIKRVGTHPDHGGHDSVLSEMVKLYQEIKDVDAVVIAMRLLY